MEAEKPFAKECEEYAEAQGLRDMMQSFLKLLLQHQPDDPLQFLIDHLKQQQFLEAQELQKDTHRVEDEDKEQQHASQTQQQQLGPPLRLVMLGLPGSERHEVSASLAERWGLPLVSSGALLRAHADTYPRGEAARALNSRTLARDELVVELVSTQLQQLQQQQCGGWILDGFPRTRAQAVALLDMRLSPDRCCLLLPGEVHARSAVRAAAAAAATAAAAAAAAAEARPTAGRSGPFFRTSTTQASERRSRLLVTKEADAFLRQLYRHTEGVLEVLGPLAETVPAEEGAERLIETLEARCGLDGGSKLRLRPPKLCIIGSSASGKSTQSGLLNRHFGVVHVDIRELLLQKAHEDADCKAALLELEAGVESSFEELLIELVAQRLASADCARRGWVLDGVPQTARQALLLRQHKITPDCILLLEAPEGTLVERVKKRKADRGSKSPGAAPDEQAEKSQQHKDAARLVELRTAQLERWLPEIREAFAGKLTTVCSDDAVSVEAVNRRILEFVANHRMPPRRPN